METVRAIRLALKESPTYRRLQQVAGTVSLLIGIVEPLAKDEPPEPASEQSEVSR